MESRAETVILFLMRTKPIVAGAVVMAVPILITIVFNTARPSIPAITVRHVKSVKSSNWVTATFEITNRIIWLGRINGTLDSTGIFEITNHTTRGYCFDAISFEVRQGRVWKKCFDFNPSGARSLAPHGSVTAALDITNLPVGSPLRLRLRVGKELTGVMGFFIRLDLRVRHAYGNVPINPFNKNQRVFSPKPTEIVSDEFVEPEPNQLGQGNSAQ